MATSLFTCRSKKEKYKTKKRLLSSNAYSMDFDVDFLCPLFAVNNPESHFDQRGFRLKHFPPFCAHCHRVHALASLN